MKVKFAWFPVWCVALLVFSMICIYLPVFGGGQSLNNFPLIIATEDAEFASSESGQQWISNLTEPSASQSFVWHNVQSKEQAIQEIRNDNAYGAIVIPENFTTAITELENSLIAGNSPSEIPEIEILINEGGSAMATGTATTTLESLASSISENVSTDVQQQLTQLEVQVPPTISSIIAEPVASSTSNVLGIASTKLNQGMTPFMMVLITSIMGIMGTNMIRGYLTNIGDRLKKDGKPLTDTKIFAVEVLFGMLLSLLVASSLQLAVFGVFDSAHASSIGIIFLFTLLCAVTMYFMFKMLSLIFGKWALLAMFPVNIIGIFASGGPVPIESLPAFHQTISMFIPTRYMVDGLSSLLYYGGNMEAGLGAALWVISLYLLLFVSVCTFYFIRTYKREHSGFFSGKWAQIQQRRYS